MRHQRVAEQRAPALDARRLAELSRLARRRSSRASRCGSVAAGSIATPLRREPVAQRRRHGAALDRRDGHVVPVRIERVGEAGRDLARAEAAGHLVGVEGQRLAGRAAQRALEQPPQRLALERRRGSPSDSPRFARAGSRTTCDVGVDVRMALEVDDGAGSLERQTCQ